MPQNDALAINHGSEGPTSIVTAHGEIDMVTIPALREALLRALETPQPMLVLDLSEVTFLSSGGLALLIEVHTLATARSVVFRVVTGTSRLVVHPIEITGIADRVSIHPDLRSALAAAGDDPMDSRRPTG